MKKLILANLIVLVGLFFSLKASALPLKTDILSPTDQNLGQALIYIDYVELKNSQGKLVGKIGFAFVKGQLELFLVREDQQKTLIGYAKHKKLYDRQNKLVAYYDWSTFWSYVWAKDGKTKLGKAKCLAFRGLCAAGVAGYLAGMLRQ